jgi:hypothetical protein
LGSQARHALFPSRRTDNGEDSAALAINNRRQIVAATTKLTLDNSVFYPTNSFKAVLLSHASGSRKTVGTLYGFGSVLENYRSVALSNRGHILISNRWYDPIARVWREIGANHRGRRGDIYPQILATNSMGNSIVGFAGTPFFESLLRKDLDIDCLVPANSIFGNSTLSFGKFSATLVASVLNNGDILASGDVVGDGKLSRLVLLKKRVAKKFGRFFDFCPHFTSPVVTCNPPVPEGYYDPTPGALCTATSTLVSAHDSVPYDGIEVGLRVRTQNTNYEYFCEDISPAVLSIASTRAGWVSTVQSSYRYSTRVSIHLAVVDPRFRSEDALLHYGNVGNSCHNDEVIP